LRLHVLSTTFAGLDENVMQEQITEWLEQLHLPAYALNLLLAGGAVLPGLLLYGILTLLARRASYRKEGFSLFRSLLVHLGTPLSFLLPVFLFNLLLPVFRASRAVRGSIGHAGEIALITGFAWLLIQLLRVMQEAVHAKLNIRRADNLRERRILTQLIYIRRVANSVIILVAIGAVLLTFSTMRKIGTGLLTGVGIGGIIIGFAAQRSLGNLLAGFQIAFTQPIRIDDEVVVENEFGTIEEITLTYVVVRIWDERRLILPITYFIEKPFQNWTRTKSEKMGTVFIYTDYSLPITEIREEFNRLVKNHPLWDKRVASMVVTDTTERVMQLRALVSAQNSGSLYDLRCHIREFLLQYIHQHYPMSLPQTRTSLQPLQMTGTEENIAIQQAGANGALT
jgi:small-conductance mechanosensitive channel